MRYPGRLILTAACIAVPVFVSLNATAAEPAAKATEKPAAEKPDAERIQGLWKATRYYLNGQLTQLGEDNSISLTFEPDTFKAVVNVDGGTQEIEGTYFLDPTLTPKSLDAAIRSGGDNRDVAVIYRLEDNSLTVALRSDGGPRPADIDNPGETTIKVVFQRQPR